MSAVACLRVDISGACEGMSPAMLGPLVQKFAGAYLEMRWSWPRRAAALTEYSFLLTDPRSEELDMGELQRLSDELQRHLFGTGEDGEVALLVCEGNQQAVTEFATMGAGSLAEALRDPARLPRGARLRRIVAEWRAATPDQAEVGAEPAEPSPEWVAMQAALRRELTAPQPPAEPAWEGFQGVYFIPRQVFFGDAVMFVPENSRTHLSLVDGTDHMPCDPQAYDEACIGIAARVLAGRPKGAILYLPLSFTTLVRPSARAAYAARLDELPTDRREELAVCIYDVPRDPAFTGLQQARALLDAHVSVIDLATADPAFEIEKVSKDLVNSVTLVLPDGDAHQRISALRRFSERLVHFKQRRIWPGVTNVRRRAELEVAARLHIPFATGPAVCSPLPSAVGGRVSPLETLPLSMREDPYIRSNTRLAS